MVWQALWAWVLSRFFRMTTSRASCASFARTSTATSSVTDLCRSVAVDEHLYRRLPAFVVATVDKFATPALGRRVRGTPRWRRPL